jgi:hypothetical protein
LADWPHGAFFRGEQAKASDMEFYHTRRLAFVCWKIGDET